MFRLTQRVLRQAAFTATRALRQDAGAAGKKVDGFLTLSFATPNVVINKAVPVHMVTLTTAEGEMGILADHAPTLAELKPCVVSVYEAKETTEPSKYFVPGGFVVVNADSSASITAADAIPLEDIDFSLAKAKLDEANAEFAKPGKSDKELAESRIAVEVFSAIMQAADKK